MGSGLCKHKEKVGIIRGPEPVVLQDATAAVQPGNPSGRPSASGSPTPATTQAAAESLNSPVVNECGGESTVTG